MRGRFTLGLATLAALSGCYLSHGRDADAAPADTDARCVRDSDCEDGDACTEDRCVSGACAHAPRPYDQVESFTVSGTAVDVTRHGGRAWVLTSPLGVESFDATGPVGDRIEFVPPGGDRDWDSTIASTGSDVAISTIVGSRLLTRVLSDPRRVEEIEIGGIFVESIWTGDLLVTSATDVDLCMIHLADGAGRSLGPVTRLSTGCPYAWSYDLGLPPSRVAIGVSPGEARFLATDAEGNVSAVAMRRDGPRERSLRLPLVAGRYVHSLVAAEGAGVLAAQWVELDDTRAETLVQTLVREEAGTLNPIAPIRTRDGTDVYALTMTTDYCSLRFAMADVDTEGVHVVQLRPDGSTLGEELSFGVPYGALHLATACIPGGAVVMQWEEVHVLSCSPP